MIDHYRQFGLKRKNTPIKAWGRDPRDTLLTSPIQEVLTGHLKSVQISPTLNICLSWKCTISQQRFQKRRKHSIPLGFSLFQRSEKPKEKLWPPAYFHFRGRRKHRLFALLCIQQRTRTGSHYFKLHSLLFFKKTTHCLSAQVLAMMYGAELKNHCTRRDVQWNHTKSLLFGGSYHTPSVTQCHWQGLNEYQNHSQTLSTRATSPGKYQTPHPH